MPLNNYDRQLWQEYTLGVKPLKGKQTLVNHTPKLRGFSACTSELMPKILTPLNVRPPNQRDLKNIHIHARLDLHGMNQDQAYDRLIVFIHNAYQKGHRCVLIITGKGLKSNEDWWQEVGILKQQVPRWLNEEPLRSKINTHTTARPEHGGTGAIYVFIKRK